MSEFTEKARALIQKMRDDTAREIAQLKAQGKATGEWQSAESSRHVAKRAAAEIIKANPLLRPEYVANSLVPTAKAMNLLGRIAELEIKLEAIDAALANIETVAAEAAGAAPAQDQNNCS